MSVTTNFISREENMSNPSLCIPRVFANISEGRIRHVLNQVNLGEIAKIDMITRENEQGQKFQRVFIHFKHWGTNPNAIAARERVTNGQTIKIVYDDPWFWNISMNTWKSKPTPPQARPQKVKPTIVFEDNVVPDVIASPVAGQNDEHWQGK